jgi:hypothetical protein
MSNCGGCDRDRNRRETVDDFYVYAKEVSKLDFVALTDHDTSLDEEDWRFLLEKASEYNEPGKFVTFPAYEWTSYAYGHLSVYYLTNNPPMIKCYDSTGKNLTKIPKERWMKPTELWSLLRQNNIEALTIPHHPPVTQFPVNWDYYDSEFESLVEITSIWGNFEYYGNPFMCPNSDNLPGFFAQDALTRGYKLGIMGGGDTHDCRPGGPPVKTIRNSPIDVKLNSLGQDFSTTWIYNPLGSGITGVYANKLDRESIFEALRARRCYATTMAKIKLNFMINEHMMGEELTLSSTDEYPKISAHVQGTTKILKIELIKNNRTIYVSYGQNTYESFEYVDEEVEAINNYYYVRVIQADGKMAWSSPIWVKWNYKPNLKVPRKNIVLRNKQIEIYVLNKGNHTVKNVRLGLYTRDPFLRITSDLKPSLKEANLITLIWRERVDDRAIKVYIRHVSRDEKHNFTGTCKIKNYLKYHARPMNFAFAKYGGDLFTNDGQGVIRWDITPSSHLNDLDIADVKGLDLIVCPDPIKDSCIEMDVQRDGVKDPNGVYAGGKNVDKIPFKICLDRYDTSAQIGLLHLEIIPANEGIKAKLDFPYAKILEGAFLYLAAEGFVPPFRRIESISNLESVQTR